MERRAKDTESLIATSHGQEAIDLAIQAAELYMQALAKAGDKAESSRLRRKCKELIALAEELKERGDGDSDSATSILRQASQLHGNTFPPWTQEPRNDEFDKAEANASFSDSTEFSLSTTQAEVFAKWTRPKELFNIPDTQEARITETLLMQATPKSSLMQDVTTDCSVVASLSAALNVLVGPRSILSAIIYPYDRQKGRPMVSKSGRYVVKLHFNGCARRVVIDDRLPASKTERGLYVVDKHNPCLLWPALLEKAYLKVRGGYDFPGSNSGTDLSVLTGWIPEQLFLQREDFSIDDTWARIKTAHDSQNVVVTLGTGRISREEEQVFGLIGEHDYAVQELRESHGLRKLLVRNPWSAGPIWKGGTWTSTLNSNGGDESSSEQDPANMPDGSIWIHLEDVAQNFESLYLNWNPALFPYRDDHHFSWKLPAPCFTSSLARNPQFCLVHPTGGVVWVLVARHFADAELDIARNKTGSMASVSRQLGFMSILVFENEGHMVQVPDAAGYRGPYVDSPQTLARLNTKAGKPYTIVLDQHEFPLPKYTFTITLLSQTRLQFSEATEAMPHACEQLGSWSRRSAGGNAASTTYFLNPQYKLAVNKTSSIHVLLSGDDRDVHMHVDLLWAGGHRALEVRAKDLVSSSGEYRRGCAVLKVPKIDPGLYTIVCSTFEPGQTGSFVLRLTSTTPVLLEPVPPPAAGRLRTSLSDLDFGEGEKTMRAMISSSRLSRASFVVGVDPSQGGISTPKHSSTMLRVSVVHGWGSEQDTIAISGDDQFQKPVTALRTPEFDIDPIRIRQQGLWVVVERSGLSAAGEHIKADIFSDFPVATGGWEPI